MQRETILVSAARDHKANVSLLRKLDAGRDVAGAGRTDRILHQTAQAARRTARLEQMARVIVQPRRHERRGGIEHCQCRKKKTDTDM